MPGNTPACPVCAEPGVASQTACGRCQQESVAYTRALVPFLYEFPADTLVAHLKFGRRVAIAKVIAGLIVAANPESVAGLDCLLAVPLHRIRKIRRGFNQSELIATAIGRTAGLPVLRTGLRRIRSTPPQSTLDRDQRRANVRGVFQANPDIIEGKRIGLIDDVVTTGATVNAASDELSAAGAAEIRIIAFARAP